jgi:hypothetical protein
LNHENCERLNTRKACLKVNVMVNVDARVNSSVKVNVNAEVNGNERQTATRSKHLEAYVDVKANAGLNLGN